MKCLIFFVSSIAMVPISKYLSAKPYIFSLPGIIAGILGLVCAVIALQQDSEFLLLGVITLVFTSIKPIFFIMETYPKEEQDLWIGYTIIFQTPFAGLVACIIQILIYVFTLSNLSIFLQHEINQWIALILPQIISNLILAKELSRISKFKELSSFEPEVIRIRKFSNDIILITLIINFLWNSLVIYLIFFDNIISSVLYKGLLILSSALLVKLLYQRIKATIWLYKQ